jgi:hypothetical protein
MNLLTGIKATDLRNQNITASIKVYIKNTEGIFTLISNPVSYVIAAAGAIQLKYQVMDSYGNITSSEISLDVASGAPVLTGISNLQTALNPKTGPPMDLLTGIKATDLKNQDITSSIKVFFKNVDGTYTQITAPKSFSTKTAGKIYLKYQINDSYSNETLAETSLTVASGLPVLTGLDNLQTAINPKVGIPMNLLTGIKATDVKSQDISNKIKVFHQTENETFSEVTNPTSHSVSVAGNLVLKYHVTDIYDQTTELQKTLNVVAEVLTIPKMQIMPTDPTFNPNNPDWHFNAVRNWTDYLKTLNIPEVWAMGEAMVRSGTNDMPKTEYLSKLNKRQIALNNAAGIPMGTDTEGQYVVPVTAFPQTYHEDICNQILLGKKNNGVGSVGIIGPLIQQ